MSVVKTKFDSLPDGREVSSYIMKNAKGTEMHVLDFGLRIQKLLFTDKNGNVADLVLGYDTIEDYLGVDFQGAFVGRYANRIGKATFSIGEEVYTLDKNDGNNSLHGGPGGYHQIIWTVKEIVDTDEPSITFTHLSPDGDEGFPGNLSLDITYTLTASDEVVFEYKASSDKTTPFNPTNHSFFTLTGDQTKEILDTVLTINSTKTTLIDDELIPTGEIVSIKDTVLDFSNGKTIGKDIASTEKTVAMNNGFDHNYCVDGEGFRLHATATDNNSGITMEVYSDMPGIQLYTSNASSLKTGKNGVVMTAHHAFCLETQFYPDSVNKPNFPFKYVDSENPFYSKTVYKFSK